MFVYIVSKYLMIYWEGIRNCFETFRRNVLSLNIYFFSWEYNTLYRTCVQAWLQPLSPLSTQPLSLYACVHACVCVCVWVYEHPPGKCRCHNMPQCGTYFIFHIFYIVTCHICATKWWMLSGLSLPLNTTRPTSTEPITLLGQPGAADL